MWQNYEWIYIRGSLGVINIAGKTEENRLLDGLVMLKEEIMTGKYIINKKIGDIRVKERMG